MDIITKSIIIQNAICVFAILKNPKYIQTPLGCGQSGLYSKEVLMLRGQWLYKGSVL